VFRSSSAKGVALDSIGIDRMVVGFQEVFQLGAILLFAALVLAAVMMVRKQNSAKNKC
jgi:hypothetical protein